MPVKGFRRNILKYKENTCHSNHIIVTMVLRSSKKGVNRLNEELHQKYKNESFPHEITVMFKEILIQQEPIAFDVLLAIFMKNRENTSFAIQDLANTIKVERKVRKKRADNTVYFHTETTTLNRKRAERIVDKLAAMSLIYTVNRSFYKYLYVTTRGRDIINMYGKEKLQKN